MKLVLLVALATVATVASYRPSVHSVVYKPGEQYVYHYKGQILNGIPKATNQFSGLIIDSLVLLQFQQDFKVIMKMENIKLYKIDNKISTIPTEALPESDMIRLTGDQEKVIVDKLMYPLKFRYEEGEVRELQKETRDEFWSMNIKKGILSIFQVTLKEKNPQGSDSSIYHDPTMSRIKSYGSRSYGSSTSSLFWSQSAKINSVFIVKETDVSGNCETKYTIVPDKTSPTGGVSTMLVTAVRNFDNCHSKPFNIEGMFQGVPVSTAEKELIQPTVHTDYIITGDRSHFLIKEATRRGKYYVFINGMEGGDLSSYVHQKLWLKQTESIRTPVHLVSPRTETRGLQMVIPKATLIEEKDKQTDRERGQYDSYLYRKRVQQEYELNKADESEDFDQEELNGGDESDIIPVVEEKMTKLTECMYTNTETKCSDILMEVTMMLREATESQLKVIYKRHVSQERLQQDNANYRTAELLLDILPTMSNPDAGKVLVELIRSKSITPFRGSLLINAMSLVIKPTPSVIKSILELFKELPKTTTETMINGETLLRQASLLSVGTMTHRLLNVMRSQGKPVPEIVTFVNSLCSELQRMLEETQNEGEKILIIKSMGNMGASDNVVTIKRIVEDRRLTVNLRISAVIAMRRMAKDFKKQVIPVLMGVVMDVNEISDLRQVAFMVIIRANPHFTTLQMIAHRINYDKCGQLKSLVYTNLVNLAYYTSHQPEHKTLTKHARLVLKTINPINVGFFDSMSIMFNKFNEELDMGMAFELTKIKSRDSGIPQAIISTLQATVLGKHRTVLELGAEGRALQAVLRKVFGPHGVLSQLLKGRINLEDILKPLSKVNLGGVEHKIANIMNKMRMSLPVEQHGMYANYFIHLLENEVQYIQLNERNTAQLYEKFTTMVMNLIGKLTSGFSYDLIKAATHQASLTVATTMGIPLHFNHTMYALLKTEGSAKINTNLPAAFASLWNTYRGLTLPQSLDEIKRLTLDIIPEFNLDLNFKPKLDVSQYVTFGTDLRWLTTGVGVEGYMMISKPFRTTVAFSKSKSSINIKYYPTKETMPVVHTRVVPILFVNYIPTTVTRLPYTLEVKEIKNEQIIKTNPFNYEFNCHLLDQEFEMKGVYSLCGPNWCPIMPLFGKQEMIIITKPSNNVEYLEMNIHILKDNFEFEGIPSHLSTDELYRLLEEETDGESINYRTASRSVLRGDEFDPVTVDPIFTNTPFKRQMRFTIKPNTFQWPAVRTQLTWFMGREKWTKNQFNVQHIYAGKHDIHSNYKMIMNTVMDLEAWINPEETFGSNNFLLKTDLKFNYNGPKTLKLKINPGSPFDFTTELKRHRLWPVDDLPEAEKQALKYTMEIEFPEMNEWMMKTLMIMDDTVKYVLYNKLTTEIPRNSESNKFIASVEILPWWEKINIIVKNPRENIFIANVPFYWNPFLTTDQKTKVHNSYTWNFYKRSFYEKIWGQEKLDLVSNVYTPLLTKGECTVDFTKRYVSTFDGAHHSIQSTLLKLQDGCGVLAAQDCSREGLFSLNMKRHVGQGWLTFLHLPEADIEVEVKSNLIKVKVNGESITLRPSQIFNVHSQIESSSILHEIELLTSDEVLINAKELGLKVRLDHRQGTAYVQISHGSMLWGRVCGLCGNNNQDPSDDLEVPRGLQVPSTRLFYTTHLIPSESCSLDTPVVSTEHCKKTDHVTIRRYDNELTLTCTSERKVLQCSEGCRPVQTRSIKTCFRCHSTSDQTHARRNYYHPASVWELEDSGISCGEFAERVEVPVTCEPAY